MGNTCVQAENEVYVSLLYYPLQSINSFNPFNSLCAGFCAWDRKQQSKEIVSCSQIVHSPPHEADKQTHCEQSSFAIMGNNNKTMVCKTVIGTGPGHCVTTGEEPVIQPQGIRKAILEENLENEKQKRS